MNADKIMEFRSYLRSLERAIGKRLKNDTVCCGVRVDECHAIMELDESGETGFGELAGRLDADKGNLSRTIESLVNKGFAVRTGPESDRRTIKVMLTDKGKAKAGFIHDICNPVYSGLFDHIPADKHETVLEGIKYLAAGFRSFHKSGKDSNICANGKQIKEQGGI